MANVLALFKSYYSFIFDLSMDNNEEDQRKRQALRSSSPFTELNQVSSDFTMAMAFQEQETLATIESSESSSNADENDDHEVAYYDGFLLSYDVFDSFDGEGQDSNTNDDGGDAGEEDEFMEDDEIDVDDLTYEELIALGEFIGQEKRGLSFNEISTCLHACRYHSSPVVANKSSGIDRCVICQVEYEEGESMVALLPCEHTYHSECISNWLRIKKICPICSTEVSPVVPKNNSNNVINSKL